MKKGTIIRDMSGFSLIEVIVTVAVIGVIATIALPHMIGWRGERQLQGSARNFAADLQLARLKSIRETENVVVEVNGATDRYQIYVDNNKNQNLDGGEETIRDVSCPVGVSINSVCTGTWGYVIPKHIILLEGVVLYRLSLHQQTFLCGLTCCSAGWQQRLRYNTKLQKQRKLVVSKYIGRFTRNQIAANATTPRSVV